MMSKASICQKKTTQANIKSTQSNRKRHESAGERKPMRSLSLIHPKPVGVDTSKHQTSIKLSGEDSASTVQASLPLESNIVVNSSPVFNKETESHIDSNSSDKHSDSLLTDTDSKSVVPSSVCNGETVSSQELFDTEIITREQSSSQKCQSSESGSEVVQRREIRRSVSISEDRLSGSNQGEIQMKTSLSESARALNDLNPEEPRTPKRRIAEDTQSVLSLTLPLRDRYPDFVLKRTQSLKKTNEALGSFFKFASRASNAAYTKLNEFKQNVITPMRNGSLASLAGSYSSLQVGKTKVL